MSELPLLTPERCVLALIDQQAGLAFGVSSIDRRMTSWIQVLLEFQRDWTRHETYDAARGIVEAHGGGYGIGLAYARDMIHPT